MHIFGHELHILSRLLCFHSEKHASFSVAVAHDPVELFLLASVDVINQLKY